MSYILDFSKPINPPTSINVSSMYSGFSIVDGTLKSKSVGHSQTAWSYIIINSKAGGRITVNAHVSSENGCDYLVAHVTSSTSQPAYNNSSGRFIFSSGNSNGNYVYDIGPGVHYIHLQYRKDSSASVGSDAGWFTRMELPVDTTGTFVNLNGAWTPQKGTSVNLNGGWVPQTTKNVNINGAWIAVENTPPAPKNLQEEYDAGRIRVYNNSLGDVETYIGRTITPNEIRGWSQKTDHLPLIKLYYGSPSIFWFKASSNYLSSSSERGFGCCMFYMDKSGNGRSMTLGAYEKRTYYSNNQVNNDMSVITNGTWGINDENHCRTTANRISAISCPSTGAYEFELNVPAGTVRINSHVINLPSDFAYAYQFWTTVHGWSSTSYNCDTKIYDLVVR